MATFLNVKYTLKILKLTMEYKTALIRLPLWTAAEIEKYAQEKGLAFATAVRCIIVEHLKENAPTVSPAKMPVDAAGDRPIKESASIWISILNPT